MSDKQQLLQSLEERVERINKDLAELREACKEPEKWRPEVDTQFWYIEYTGIRWIATTTENHYQKVFIKKLIELGNCYQTKSEAEEVATQRNFITDYLSAGDLGVTENGWAVWLTPSLALMQHETYAVMAFRKFSTREKLLAWIEKWGGESEVCRRLQRGWV